MTHPQAPARPDGIPEDVLVAARKAAAENTIDPTTEMLVIAGRFDEWEYVRVAARAIMAERQRVEAECTAKLSDPNAVHAMMLRGTIAMPSISQIVHLYGTDALYRATGG